MRAVARFFWEGGECLKTLQALFFNYALAASLLSWLAAQILKTLLYFFRTGKLRLERMFGAGGMPSAHSAMVCSLVISIARVSGVGSPEFAIAVLFAIIVMYGATGVRRAAGEQAKRLNRLIADLRVRHMLDEEDPKLAPERLPEDQDDFFEGTDDPNDDKELKEYLGHTPMEVLGGALLGIIIAMLMPAA